MRSRLWLTCLALSSALVVGLACNGQPATPTKMVAMRDGVKLATDVYLPKEGGPKFPTILLRTPYNKQGNQGTAATVARYGYALVVQDMRGRFASEGHHAIIFGNDGIGGEHQDGHDTIDWIAEQAWSNGQIITYGQSALGIVQNMAAPRAPAALKGQVVGVAFSDYYHQTAYQGGVWRFEPNSNTGDPHPIAGNRRIAANSLHLSEKHPSHIVLPIYSDEARLLESALRKTLEQPCRVRQSVGVD